MGPKNSKSKKSKKTKEKEQEQNQTIEEQLQMESESAYKKVKVLVLGTGESGKTTFLKQLRILHKQGFEEQDLLQYKVTIKQNAIIHTKALLNACSMNDWDLLNENKEMAQKFLRYETKHTSLTTEVGEEIRSLWTDQALQTAYENRHLFQLPDSTDYFLDNIKRIAEEDYIPTERDMLNCRIPTTGVNEISFKFGEIPWSVIDVGGQRSERRKWIHQFEDVTLIIYVVAASEFNQKLYEDESINRIIESLTLFRKTANNEFFKEKNCVIFLNKIDLFREKIKKYDLSETFPDYKGGNDVDEAKKFLKKKFLSEGQNGKRNIFVHETCATDTKNIEMVFDAVNTSILEESLKIGGYI
ncbi:guanine nucleotide-binding protein g(o) subunit alpha [Anaeramoeba flamelloides]|uniref:Guanine nucleotide-binding protein g(O) subunit alpha n=1 Tax=Anaeramoeba flamelloides TaxID=1746091 RepID=A0AAV7Y5L6_9EUKA|nr:guanine nucleotide-binding protein g(o) subunit alpha [Anaeramoeba flamelloides]KAJ6227841.1 guanine nucleotide-binding protein g(o) subunit alpha [Anaeramoeba flamelloides]